MFNVDLLGVNVNKNNSKYMTGYLK